MKILAIDFGERRIGIAMGHSETKMAFPRDFIDTQRQNQWKELQMIIEDERPKLIVVGYPERTDGKSGEKVKVVDQFIQELESRFKMSIHRQNEAFSSVEAKSKTQHYTTKKKKQEKGRIDSAAAAVFLQEYLDSL